MDKYQYPVISKHPTLNKVLEVDWQKEYRGEYQCPKCNNGKLLKAYNRNYQYSPGVVLRCNLCKKRTYLTCQVPARFHQYSSKLECPNPLCKGIGPNGQKGWIYFVTKACNIHTCFFCKIYFNPLSDSRRSWVRGHQKKKMPLLDFSSDTWDLGHFFDKPKPRNIKFLDIRPHWYCQEVKRHLQSMLQKRIYRSESSIHSTHITLKQFGQVVDKLHYQQISDITRESVILWLESLSNLKESTIIIKLGYLKDFIEGLELEVHTLVKQRDYPKNRHDDPEWLDEPSRSAIRSYLHKLPPPLARNYLVQEYTAARPGDVCNMSFDCLREENGKWYIDFLQGKGERWHRIPASRQIRQIIEKQQQWIRQILGPEYPYLFCHFRSFSLRSYPNFPTIKPLPEPPMVSATGNPMVRAIRYMIEAEDIRDSNGQLLYFSGKITRASRLQEVRAKHGLEATQLYADHKHSQTTLQHYAPPTREQVAENDLPFQKLLLNPDNRFLPWQSLPESLLQDPTAHELDIEVRPRLTVYGYCSLAPKIPCPHDLYPKCYGCNSFRPSTGKLPLYERQYQGEQQRREEAHAAGAELVYEEANATLEAMNSWLPQLREVANG